MDDIQDLVVTPFRDIVEKGKTAVENAGDDKPMLKAAQSLVKEGERALKRIEPLCRKHLEEYGSNFLDALKENDDIANFRTELTDLLWEFDDYIELEDFEVEKYAELQGASRKAAPKIYDILMRMKLEVPPDNDARSIVMMRMSSRPSSPPPIPLPPLPPSAAVTVQSHVTPEPPAEIKSKRNTPTVEEATAQLKSMMQSQSGPDEGLILPPPVPPPALPLPPRPPSANPWDVRTPPVPTEGRLRDDFAFERRAPVTSPDSPAMSPISPGTERKISSGRPRIPKGIDRLSQQSDESRPRPPKGIDRLSQQSDESRPRPMKGMDRLSQQSDESRPRPRKGVDRRSNQSDDRSFSPGVSESRPRPIKRMDRSSSHQSDDGNLSPGSLESRPRVLNMGFDRSSQMSDERSLSPGGFESRPRPLNMGFDRSSQMSDERNLSPGGLETASYERGYSVFPGQPPRSRTPNSSSFLSSSIPEDFVLNRGNDRGSGTRYAQPAPRYSQNSQLPPPSQQLSRPESLESDPSSVFDHRRTDRGSTSGTSEHRSSAISAAQSSPTLPTSELSPTSPVQPVQQLSPMKAVEADYGPIPVETENEPAPNLKLSTVDCTISANSSFYIQKGFCDGAQEVIRGGIGIRKTKRPGFTTATTVARCLHCFYELDFNEIELDVNKSERGNFTKNGIGFRLRFLQKSHIPTRRVDDVLYGCLFCISSGRTLNASDATVFLSQKALFQHLARHPRPLPNIPGLTVVDQADVPDLFRNNYDLHFRNPPEPHPVAEKADELALLPTGCAKEAARRMYGQRLLFDRTPALEMVQGAKITGITWPEKYVGEWAFGWHDGVHASVPMEILRLDQPPADEIKLPGTSQIRATAKWKFNPKDKDKFKGDWLKFDKDEVITNISWPYQDYWCWSGTNAKGKWGIFPQAFINSMTVEDMSQGLSDRASVVSNEKSRSMSMLSRFSTKRSARSGRPPSIAGSTNSNETQPPTLPPLHMYTTGSRG